MSFIAPLDRKDYRELYRLAKRLEPYSEYDHFDLFCGTMNSRRGFTVRNSAGDIVSLISYSNFIPGNSVVIHFLQDMGAPGSLTKDVVRTAFRFPFLSLHVPIVTSYSIIGVTDEAEKFLLRLGFTEEGVRREAARLPDGPRDIKLYGMLKRECRWIV